jgi:hypothetical protein
MMTKRAWIAPTLTVLESGAEADYTSGDGCQPLSNCKMPSDVETGQGFDDSLDDGDLAASS